MATTEVNGWQRFVCPECRALKEDNVCTNTTAHSSHQTVWRLPWIKVVPRAALEESEAEVERLRTAVVALWKTSGTAPVEGEGWMTTVDEGTLDLLWDLVREHANTDPAEADSGRAAIAIGEDLGNSGERS